MRHAMTVLVLVTGHFAGRASGQDGDAKDGSFQNTVFKSERHRIVLYVPENARCIVDIAPESLRAADREGESALLLGKVGTGAEGMFGLIYLPQVGETTSLQEIMKTLEKKLALDYENFSRLDAGNSHDNATRGDYSLRWEKQDCRMIQVFRREEKRCYSLTILVLRSFWEKHRRAIDAMARSFGSLDPAKHDKEQTDQFKAGSKALDAGEWHAAFHAFDFCLQRDPNWTKALINRGWARLELGDPDGAIVDETRALGLDSSFASAWLNRGLGRMARGDLDRALEDLTKAVELDSRSINAAINRGNVLRAKGRLEEAQAEYERALKLDPRDIRARGNRGVALQAQGKLDEALADYAQILEQDSRCAKGWLLQGSARASKGELKEAAQDLDRAIDLDPGLAEAWQKRGEVRKALGEPISAESDLRKALQLRQANPEVRGILRGTATDASTHHGMPGVTISATPQGSRVETVTFSDEQGDFELLGLAPGKYAVTLTYGEIVLIREDVEIAGDRITMLENALDTSGPSAETHDKTPARPEKTDADRELDEILDGKR